MHATARGLPVVKRTAVMLAGLAGVLGAVWWHTARAPAPAPRPAPTTESGAPVERPRPTRPRPAPAVARVSPAPSSPPPSAPRSAAGAASAAALDSPALTAQLAALDRRWQDWPEAVFVCQADGEHVYRPEEHDPLAADVYKRKFPDGYIRYHDPTLGPRSDDAAWRDMAEYARPEGRGYAYDLPHCARDADAGAAP
jgi:hypothetical protein